MPTDPTTIPGWAWMPGMLTLEVLQPHPWTLPLWDEARVLTAAADEPVRVCTVLGKVRDLHPGAQPDPTDRATAGCLLALLGSEVHVCYVSDAEHPWDIYHTDRDTNRVTRGRALTLGAACIAVAESLGRWPGGDYLTTDTAPGASPTE